VTNGRRRSVVPSSASGRFGSARFSTESLAASAGEPTLSVTALMQRSATGSRPLSTSDDERSCAATAVLPLRATT
jgi:hypothetical protein